MWEQGGSRQDETGWGKPGAPGGRRALADEPYLGRLNRTKTIASGPAETEQLHQPGKRTINRAKKGGAKRVGEAAEGWGRPHPR